MKSIDGFERRFKVLSVGSKEAMSPEFEAFLASCTPAEVTKISEILMRFDDDEEFDLEQLTPDEIEFLVKIFERPVPPLPAIDHSQPRCHACGRQPAHLWDPSDVFPFCDACFEQLGGMADVSKLPRDRNGNFPA
jgi:hypothetical protein